MQIDGEYYKLVNPLKIEIKLDDRFGHMKILKNIEWFVHINLLIWKWKLKNHAM